MVERAQVAFNLGQWLIAFAVFVDIEAAGIAAFFLQQTHAVPLELGALGLGCLTACGQAGFSSAAANPLVLKSDAGIFQSTLNINKYQPSILELISDS